MRVGVTGSRTAPTRPQTQILKRKLAHADTVSHGCCLGVDSLSHYIATRAGKQVNMRPALGVGRNRCVTLPVTRLCHEFEAKPTKDRNQDIVDESEWLIAVPRYAESDSRSGRSGTWQTVRMAREAGTPITIIYSDGTYKDENWPEDWTF